jgi:hypothetical protein
MSNIHQKIERSSIGTPAAQRARGSVATATAAQVVARAAALPRAIPRKKPGGQHG